MPVGRDLDVRRFEIPVNDAALVGGFEGINQLARDRQHVGDRKRSFLNLGRETLPGNELHDQIVEALVFFQTVDRGNVGMVQRREYTRLTLEARHALLVRRKMLGQHFDRDVPPELRVPSSVDFPHPARTERSDDLIEA